MNNQNKQPRPHAELIKAWADGTTIQYFDEEYNKWFDCAHGAPSWHATKLYRIKPEEPERRIEPKQGDTYLYIDSDGIVVATTLENRAVDDRRRYFGNCFTSEREAKIAAVRVKAALKGEEPEELNKLRKENEELKKELAKDEEEIDVLGAEVDALKSVMSDGEKDLAQLNLSAGERALIRAIRKAEVISTWERNSAVLVYEAAGDLVSRNDIVAFFTDGTDADDDEIRAALDAISQEQEEACNE